MNECQCAHCECIANVHSATDEGEDQHQLLQVQDQRWLLHHVKKQMVQLYEPLDQGGGVHRVYQHCGVVSI